KTFAVRDVANRTANQSAFLSLQRAEADLDGKLRPVLAPPKKFQAGAHRTHFRIIEEPRAMPWMLGPEPLGHQHFDRLVEQLRARVSEQGFRLRVHEDDVS